MKHDDTIVHGERLDRLEARNARLQEQSAIAEEHLQQLRSEVRTLRVAIQRLTRENPGSVMVVQLDVPGLRENIIRQAQERRIERSDQERSEEEINEPSDQGSNWDPEEEAFGDNAQGGCKSTEASRHMKGTMAHWSVPQALQWQHFGTRKKRPLRTQESFNRKKNQ